MEKRELPVIIVQCPDCNAVFAASVMEEKHPFDSEFHSSLCEYAKDGYKIEVVESTGYVMKGCNCSRSQNPELLSDKTTLKD